MPSSSSRDARLQLAGTSTFGKISGASDPRIVQLSVNAPGGSVAGTSTFGKISSASDPRIVQLSVKVKF
jgi:hypothetical protein